MMFANRFVCSIKVNGKILRENSGTVTLPFGCEYEILLKNLNSRRAMVSVDVDGKNASDGRLIIGPNQTVTLERWIRNGNLSSGNRFKFIERTTGIEAHRGIKQDDGLVRCEFWAEKEVIDAPIVRHHYHDVHHYHDPYYYPPYTLGGIGGSIQCNAMNVGGTADAGLEEGEPCRGGGPIYGRAQGGAEAPGQSVNVAQVQASLNDAGITVPGSQSNQQFYRISGFPLESNSTVIVLQLRGDVGGVAVQEAVTVERKPVCESCGTKNRALNRFCDQCGTALILI